MHTESAPSPAEPTALRRYLDTLGRGESAQLAGRLGISSVYLLQLAARQEATNGRPREPKPELAVQIEQATGIPCEELRSDVRWVRIPDPAWPNGKPLLDVTPPAAPSTPTPEAAQEA